jgi:mRNA interferase MazF
LTVPVRRGDLYWADLPGGRRPIVIVTRTAAIAHLTHVTAAAITTTLREIPSHVPVGEEHGLRHESNINCDVLVPVRVAELTERIGSLDETAQRRLDAALRFALGLQDGE